MKLTTAFARIAELNTRVRVIQGGTSASKTYSILQLLIILAQTSKEPLLISIVSESLPHLKRGAMRDFFAILMGEGIYQESAHNKTDSTYRIGKCLIEFFSVDQPDKVRGARRDILFINEANNISLEAYNQLEVRTRSRIYIDYNPTNEFWVHDEVLSQSDSSFLVVTYRDNEMLDESIIAAIEKRKPVYSVSGDLLSGNENWWRIYGEGQTGIYEGLIFQQGKHWEIVPKLPTLAELRGYGQDFGYSNDPAALVAVSELDGSRYLQEIIYQTELTNIYDETMSEEEKRNTLQWHYETMGVSKSQPISADSAEPKSINDLQRKGYQVIAASKGADSIRNGIIAMQSQKFYVTQDSINLIKELRNYCWRTDKRTGKQIDIPIDDFNHGIDAVRYFYLLKIGKKAIDKKPRINQTVNRYAQYL